jgi:hypothetical protein
MTIYDQCLEDRISRSRENLSVRFPVIGERVHIDLAPEFMDTESYLHLGIVAEWWTTRSGEVRAIVEVLGFAEEGSFLTDVRSTLRGGLFLTAPFRDPDGSPLKAIAPADQLTQLRIEMDKEGAAYVAYLDEMDELRKDPNFHQIRLGDVRELDGQCLTDSNSTPDCSEVGCATIPDNDT